MVCGELSVPLSLSYWNQNHVNASPKHAKLATPKEKEINIWIKKSTSVLMKKLIVKCCYVNEYNVTYAYELKRI